MSNIIISQTRNSIISRSSEARIQRFGSGGASIRSNTPLTDDQIRAAAPSIFAAAKHESRSERYSYIPTSEVLSVLRREGFQPFSVNQGGSRDEEKRNFTKHMIRLRHESALSVGVGSTFNEIVLVNSHDGTSTYQLMAGMFRLVCANGMVVGEGLIENVKVRHSGEVTHAVVEGCYQVLNRLPEVSESMREMDALRLNVAEQQAFARAALVARYDEKEAPIEAPRLLELRRREDSAPTLWNTFNTVQENIMKGGLSYIDRDENGRRKARRHTREVKAIDQNVGINRALWTLAEEMKRIKAEA